MVIKRKRKNCLACQNVLQLLASEKTPTVCVPCLFEGDDGRKNCKRMNPICPWGKKGIRRIALETKILH